MARQEHPREDLLRDARALTPRIELHRAPARADERVRANATQVVFAGWRAGALSLYFGEDPVYHFTTDGALRRAFVADRLVKAERGTLVTLSRQRTLGEVQLIRHELDPAEQAAWLAELHSRLQDLTRLLKSGDLVTHGEFPAGSGARAALIRWLAEHPRPDVATKPGLK
jgi:hypothetical protein